MKKKLTVILLMLLLSGCAIDIENYEKAKELCADHDGLASAWLKLDYHAKCNDGIEMVWR